MCNNRFIKKNVKNENIERKNFISLPETIFKDFARF